MFDPFVLDPFEDLSGPEQNAIYQAYECYLLKRRDNEPFYTYSGWLRAGQPKAEVDKNSA